MVFKPVPGLYGQGLNERSPHWPGPERQRDEKVIGEEC